MTHGDGSSLSTRSCDLVAQFVLALRNYFCYVCKSFAERAMEGQQQQKPIETKWRHGEERYQSEAAKERSLMGDRHTKGGQK